MQVQSSTHFPSYPEPTVPKNRHNSGSVRSIGQIAANYPQPKSGPRVTAGSLEPEKADTPDQKRFWVKVNMRAKDTRIQPIIEEWRTDRKLAENIAKAIDLLAAMERGDLDTVRRLAPMLPAALGSTESSPKKTRKLKRDPLLTPDSDSFIDSLESKIQGEEGDQIVSALVKVTGADPIVERRRLNGLALRLRTAGYTAEDVLDWYQRYWLVLDWRGLKKEKTPLRRVKEVFGRVKTL